MLTLDPTTARRFILGKQGLWPGRRWRGLTDLPAAIRAMEYLQLDPLQIIARSQDIALHSRVIDYSPGLWQQPAYERRLFFDWGGWLAARPMAELPHWRVFMHREREDNQYLRAIARDHAAAVAEMRDLLRERRTVTNRDFAMGDRTRTVHYRGRKDSALALYYLWRTGDVMTHHREKFERVYALTEDVAPPDLIYETGPTAADRFLFLKEIAFKGLTPLNRAADRPVRDSLLAEGAIIPVQVEGRRALHYALGDDVARLEVLAAGRIPPDWLPIGPTTTEEAVFLAPLDPVSARGRAKREFGFDYVWEVYKPADKRLHGYYVLPILWGDRLVGRFDSKLHRPTNTLIVLSFHLEEPALAADPAFGEALARAFGRFVAFLGDADLDATGIPYPALRRMIG